MVLQNIKCFLKLIIAERRGLINYIGKSIMQVIIPVIAVYFLLKFIFLQAQDQTKYYKYLFISLLYLNCILSLPGRVVDWLKTEKQRGTLETICISRIGVPGVLTYIFIVYVLIFSIVEMPFYIFIAIRFLPLDFSKCLSLEFIIFLIFNVILSYGLTFVSASIMILYDVSLFSSHFLRAYNFFSGAYFSINILPFFVRIFSYLLPFTYGLILLRKIMSSTKTIFLVDFIPFALFTSVILCFGLFLLEKAMLFKRKNNSLRDY
jgi:ABC-2 type transport system permease protein